MRLQNIGCEPKNLYAEKTLELLVLWASTQTASCSVQEEEAQEDLELLAADPVGHRVIEAV